MHAQRFELPVNTANAAALGNLPLKLRVVHPSHCHLRAVVENDVHRQDVLAGFSGHLGMHAAGVVAQHAAEAVKKHFFDANVIVRYSMWRKGSAAHERCVCNAGAVCAERGNW